MAHRYFSLALAGFISLHGHSYAQSVITDDSYFYGDSPPVYPSPYASGIGTWETAYSKAKALVAQLTLEEKVNLTEGITVTTGCGGQIPPIERVGFPGLCLSDAGNGLRGTDFTTAWPSGIHVGASWNTDLTYKRAYAMGKEFKKKGVNVLLGPVVGPIGRVVEGGRNWEGFSVDPYLSGKLVEQTVPGAQKAGVITSTKHFIANEQEAYRSPSDNVSAISSNIDDVTMHELYLWPFQDAVRAGTANIMCSYQRINNSYGCQNSKTLNGLLKNELGFQGFVVSDWGALHAGYDAALAGLDMVMPDSDGNWGSHLVEAVNNGSVSEIRINDMAARILSAWYQMGQDEDFPVPGAGMPISLTAQHDIIDARDVADKPIIFQGAVEGHVLVKNSKNALPLKSPRLLSILGYSAKAPDQVSVDSYAWPLGYESARNYLLALAGILGYAEPVTPEPIAFNGTIIGGGGSGATPLSTFIAPFDALVSRADADNTQLYWDFETAEPTVMQSSDACLVFGNAFASENFDRTSLRDDYTDGLILSVASQCANTIVILHNAGTRLVDQWIGHENVTAVIFAHLPGQDSGKALVSLLYGESNFSGKLPYTVAKNESDYGLLLSNAEPSGQYKYFPQDDFSEGVYIDYRRFDKEGIEPRFAFGFGLSYTTFNYSGLGIDLARNATNKGPYPVGNITQGGQADLWEVVARITALVSNTGSVDGAEVAQLYLGIPNAPKKQLRGFQKPVITAGSSETVTFELTRRDLSVWDVVAQSWKLQSGSYRVYVGSSSRDLPLQGTLNISTCTGKRSRRL